MYPAPACQYLAVTQCSICPAVFFSPLSTKPHPPFLTARSLVDRHVRILFSFERNLDNSRVSLRNMIQPKGWNIFFPVSLDARTELEPKGSPGGKPCLFPSAPGTSVLPVGLIPPFRPCFQWSRNLEEFTLNHMLFPAVYAQTLRCWEQTERYAPSFTVLTNAWCV